MTGLRQRLTAEFRRPVGPPCGGPTVRRIASAPTHEGQQGRVKTKSTACASAECRDALADAHRGESKTICFPHAGVRRLPWPASTSAPLRELITFRLANFRL
ncbi:hypothetical protein EVAR_78964_1 [Eumeta japonica]|uniref:Uncharacterized protein n=1 Tax=Eumeta variegata TaxID=151549 RepID=A0A4C1USR5_EUMVA|nr:hypothetical protein EVAR_78964_1 [Eumeta japonica]